MKKLGGHAGELYVAAELSKLGIPNLLLPENFSDDDLLAGKKDGAVLYRWVHRVRMNRHGSRIATKRDVGDVAGGVF